MTFLAWTVGALLALPASAFAQAADSQPLDVQARVLMGTGDAHGALRLMREHVAAHPDDRDARLDLARYLTWNGDYSAARRVLDADPAAEQTHDGQVVLASILAWAGRIDAARRINAPLLAADPDDFLPNYTQAIALRQSARPRTALPFVETVKRTKPGTKDARDLERGTHVRTDSFVALGYQHGSDSDHLTRSMPTLHADLARGDAWHYTIDLGRWDYRSPLASPFASVASGRSIAETRGLFGLRYASSLRTEWTAAIGHSTTGNDGLTLWRAGVDFRASDDWRLGLVADRDWFAASPRSVSLGVSRTGVSGHAQWTPNFDWTGDLWVRHDQYSDNNSSIDWNAAMRRAVVRQPGFLLDLGIALQHLGYDRNPGDGYYAPDNYRRYALTASSYVGLSENVGLSLQAGLGRQRDETFTSWRRANDAAVTLVCGILSPWQLNLTAAYSERVQTTGAYTGYSWGMTLTRRF
jgi:hypothetical protein